MSIIKIYRFVLMDGHDVGPGPMQSTVNTLTEQQLIERFKQACNQLVDNEKKGFWTFFRNSNTEFTQFNGCLDDILRHAFFPGGQWSLDVLKTLNWVDDLGNITLNNETLIAAKKRIDSQNKVIDNAILTIK